MGRLASHIYLFHGILSSIIAIGQMPLKPAKVKELQGKACNVAMVGDVINDAPTLIQADIGIVIGSGTNVAIESAGIILVRNDSRDIAKVVRLSAMTRTKMIQYFRHTTGSWRTRSMGIPPPAFSAVLISASTVFVSVNAVLFGRQKL